MSLAYTFNPLQVPEGVDFCVDDTDPDYTYMCFCRSGVAKTDTGWAILRITKTTNNPTGRWANGLGFNLKSNLTYDGRAGYTYAE